MPVIDPKKIGSATSVAQLIKLLQKLPPRMRFTETVLVTTVAYPNEERPTRCELMREGDWLWD